MSSLIRKPAPAFKAPAVLPSGEIKEVTLADYKGKWVVLLFYPLDFTFVCPTELIAFSEAVEQFKAINAEVLGVSCDSEYSHLAWANTPRKQGGLGPNFKLTLVADRSREMARAYGCLLEADGHPLRGTYIIGPDGVVHSITVNDTPVGRSVTETKRIIEAFQYVEKFGEACPVNFVPGAATIKADPKGAKEYFEKNN
ncbi:hypothetical protein H9P43_007611 [Blastocladiella emersonii ATCC 22665]|nr:hypothetical protein H9P43_007611 [Blastocladiella emersonii ATCC 22665]